MQPRTAALDHVEPVPPRLGLQFALPDAIAHKGQESLHHLTHDEHERRPLIPFPNPNPHDTKFSGTHTRAAFCI